MSGDAFGNGMLLSGISRPAAAFDHRHVFLDPDPGRRAGLHRVQSGRSALARSTWDDYNRVPHLRGRRRPPAHDEGDPGVARGAQGLGIDAESLPLNELILASCARWSTSSGAAASAPT